MIAGRAYNTAPITGRMGLDVIANRLGKSPMSWLNRGQDDVIRMMGNYGAGSRGVVYASFKNAKGATEFHYFNVVNQKGIIRFLDGQSGTAGDLSKYTIQKFLRTN